MTLLSVRLVNLSSLGNQLTLETSHFFISQADGAVALNPGRDSVFDVPAGKHQNKEVA